MAITELEMADMVREACFDAGDGPLALNGALPGYRAFAATLGPGATFPYVIQGVADPAQWEAGVGTIDGEGRLARTPHASSAGAGAVDFTAGEKHVGLALHAGWVERVNSHGHGLAEVEGLEAALAGTALSTVDDANVTLTLGGGAAHALLTPASITAGWSGQLPVARGGTGAAALEGYVKANGTAAMSASATIPSSAIDGLGTMATQNAGAVAITGGTAIFSTATVTRVGAGVQAVSVIDVDAGQSATLQYRVGGVRRWEVGKTTAAELGSNSGSNFAITRRDDAGASLGIAIQINRATGAIDLGGNVLASSDNSQTMGGPANRWSVIYAGSGAINTSDVRAKCDVGAVETALIEAWDTVDWGRYRFVASVAAKGEAARWHVGLVAQQVRDAIDARMGEGAAVRWGLLCHDSWDAEPEQRAEDGVLLRAARPAGDRWGLRYDECFALEAVMQRRRLAAIEARLAALETGGAHGGG